MKTSYTRTKGKQLTYEISTNRFGDFTITLGGKVLRQVFQPRDGLGISKWGTKAQEMQAARLAEGDIEQLRGMEEE